MSRPVIASVGAGRMGRGIAHVFAYAGYEVRLVDLKPRPADDFERLKTEALAEVRSTLDMLAGLGLFDADAIEPIMNRIDVAGASDAQQALSGARVIFEAVPETREAKTEALAAIGALADSNAIVASTTSTFLVSELAGLIEAPERFLNAHWLNPAFLIPLVELSAHDGTAADVTAELKTLLEDVGKVPVLCAASPGYIVPRIQALAMNEAARMVEEGAASAEDIDKAVRYGFGFRFAILGLIEFIDWGGGDILYYASRYMTEAMKDDRFAAPDCVVENMEKGHIGLKTGKGFYDYSGIDVDAYRREKLGHLVDLLKHMHLARPPG